MLKLNLGCGEVRPEGWINTDSSLNANLQRIPVVGTLVNKMFKTVTYNSSNIVYMNLNKPWSAYKDNSVDIVYASHLFEHLTLVAADLFLKESYRCLKPGGVIRIVVPDLYKICKKYTSDYENGDVNASDFIMWAINMHREGQYGSGIGFFKKQVLEWQGYPHQHKYMYDEKSLGKKMTAAGFKDLNSLEYGVSRYIQEIKDVEGDRERYLSVYLEGKKLY
jgi:predicted SAM-dependent methyltransferase